MVTPPRGKDFTAILFLLWLFFCRFPIYFPPCFPLTFRHMVTPPPGLRSRFRTMVTPLRKALRVSEQFVFLCPTKNGVNGSKGNRHASTQASSATASGRCRNQRDRPSDRHQPEDRKKVPSEAPGGSCAARR